MGTHARSAIKHYAVNMLKTQIDVGERVFANRPDPIFLEELPCICVYFDEETTDILSGDRYHVREYQRETMLVVCIVVEDLVAPQTSINISQRGEDFIDYLGYQVEQAFFDDIHFARNLTGFDPNTNVQGLTLGQRLLSVAPYEVAIENEKRMIAQELKWVLPYQTPGYVNKKYPTFAEYYADIVRVGSTEETIDRVLIAAEGPLTDGTN